MGQTCMSLHILADAGLPMILLTFPAMLTVLVPVILVEAWLYRRWMSLKAGTALKSSGVANLASTLIGVPVAWCAVLLLDFVALGGILRIPTFDRVLDKQDSPLAAIILTILAPAWLGPGSKYWMVPLATIMLLVPTFFLSVWIERFIVYRMVKTSVSGSGDFSRLRIGVVVRNANLVSYGLLIVGSLVWLLVSLISYPR